MKATRAYVVALKRFLLQKSKPYPTSRPPRPHPPPKPFRWRPKKMNVDFPPLDVRMDVDEPFELGELKCSALDDQQGCVDMDVCPSSPIVPRGRSLTSSSRGHLSGSSRRGGSAASRSLGRSASSFSRGGSGSVSSGASLPNLFSRVNSMAACLPAKPPPPGRKIAIPSGRFTRGQRPADAAQHLAGPTVAPLATGPSLPDALSGNNVAEEAMEVPSPFAASSRPHCKRSWRRRDAKTSLRSASRSPVRAPASEQLSERCRRRHRSPSPSSLRSRSRSPSASSRRNPRRLPLKQTASPTSPCPSPAPTVPSALPLADANGDAAGQHPDPASPLSRNQSPPMPSRDGTLSPLDFEQLSPEEGPITEHVDGVVDVSSILQNLSNVARNLNL